MALITDPDSLNLGTELTINTGTRQFTLVASLERNYDNP